MTAGYFFCIKRIKMLRDNLEYMEHAEQIQGYGWVILHKEGMQHLRCELLLHNPRGMTGRVCITGVRETVLLPRWGGGWMAVCVISLNRHIIPWFITDPNSLKFSMLNFNILTRWFNLSWNPEQEQYPLKLPRQKRRLNKDLEVFLFQRTRCISSLKIFWRDSASFHITRKSWRQGKELKTRVLRERMSCVKMPAEFISHKELTLSCPWSEWGRIE